MAPIALWSTVLIVSSAFSLAKRPVERDVKAKTEETTTNAISTMAVSRPVMPRYSPIMLCRHTL